MADTPIHGVRPPLLDDQVTTDLMNTTLQHGLSCEKVSEGSRLNTPQPWTIDRAGDTDSQ